MLDRYLDFINQHINDIRKKKLLLAVSGGVDSMVMLHLSIAAKHSVAVAHINHDMRGIESEKDAQLVKSTCENNQIAYHQYTFTPAQKVKSNFQERARNIRYDWWQSLCKEYGYDYIFTAHHSSDSVETFFINLSRGAGLSGLSSIPISNGKIFRPLASFTKNDITHYAEEELVAYREDESNTQKKYLRNSIRNEWIPFLKERDNQIENKILKSIENLRREKALLDLLVKQSLNKYITTQGNITIIDVFNLNIEFQSVTSDLLYQYLSSFGFSYDTCIKSIVATTGSEYASSSHELLKNRNTLMLREKKNREPVNIIIQEPVEMHLADRTVKISQGRMEGGLAIYNLDYPFTIRTKASGDRFQPSGMKGASKKVKDFLTDLKMDKWTKQETLVLERDNVIVAVLPYRVSQGFHSKSSKEAVYIRID